MIEIMKKPVTLVKWRIVSSRQKTPKRMPNTKVIVLLKPSMSSETTLWRVLLSVHCHEGEEGNDSDGGPLYAFMDWIRCGY